MTTRDKILSMALTLFNKCGSDAVTVRHIAKELGISHGNLCYHFPRTEDIIQQLHLNVMAELDQTYQQVGLLSADVTSLVELLSCTFEQLYAYRFLMMDFARIMRAMPTVKQQLRVVYQRRQAQFYALVKQLVACGDFLAEQYPGQHEYFVTQCFLLSDFWLTESGMLTDATPEDQKVYYIRLACGLIYPYLTPQGQARIRPHLVLANG